MSRSTLPIALLLTTLLTTQAWAVPARGPLPGASQLPTETVYRVKKGDSLYAIARRSGLSVTQLKALNGLKNDVLKPGQQLELGPPRESTPAMLAGPDSAEALRKESAAGKAAPTGPTLVDITPDTLEEVAYAYLSTPYRFGGSSRGGVDCSSFVQQVFQEIDIPLPRTAREQYRIGSDVPPGELQSGDLLFFRTYAKYPSHVGIYLGEQKMIHASPRSRRVVIANIDTPYFRSRFIGAKRPALLAAPLDIEALALGVEVATDTEVVMEPATAGN